MNKKKKAISLFFTGILMLSLTSCMSRIPSSTSIDWGLYKRSINGVETIVDETGQVSSAYSLDKKGNVIDSDRTIIIGKDNCFDFIPVENIVLDDDSIFDVSLESVAVDLAAQETGIMGTQRKIQPVEKTSRVTLTVSPADATCKEFSILSNDTVNLSLSPIGEDTADESTGTLSCKAVGGVVVFDFTCRDKGEYTITVKSVDDNVERIFPVIVSVSEIIRSTSVPEGEIEHGVTQQNTGGSTSTSLTNTILSGELSNTENTPAWIKGSKVNLREKMSTSSNVLGTYKSGQSCTVLASSNGWTKIAIDGQTGYVKSVYITITDPNENNAGIGSNTTSTRNTVSNSIIGNTTPNSNSMINNTAANAPVTANDGYDHGYAFSSNASIGTNHAHDYEVSKVVEATPESKGYTVYKCSCGATYVDNETTYNNSTGGHIHSYGETVIAPTCNEPGCTEHSCVCGDVYRDNYINMTGHDFIENAKNSIEGQTICEYMCTKCGFKFTEYD